jgi:hypothetical protein
MTQQQQASQNAISENAVRNKNETAALGNDK